ncbi:hypothetical protein GCM10007880_61050 [Mesorhizobium amorphae]|nr:hypothetical protein GCM10007880_61050 [Mesorhizobium amorphae]
MVATSSTVSTRVNEGLQYIVAMNSDKFRGLSCTDSFDAYSYVLPVVLEENVGCSASASNEAAARGTQLEHVL